MGTNYFFPLNNIPLVIDNENIESFFPECSIHWPICGSRHRNKYSLCFLDVHTSFRALGLFWLVDQLGRLRSRTVILSRASSHFILYCHCVVPFLQAELPWLSVKRNSCRESAQSWGSRPEHAMPIFPGETAELQEWVEVVSSPSAQCSVNDFYFGFRVNPL